MVIEIQDNWNYFSFLKNASKNRFVLRFANCVFYRHPRWLTVARYQNPCFKRTAAEGCFFRLSFPRDLMFFCFFSVLSDRSCLRVTAGPASLDLDVSVQRTLDNNLATEAYERRIKRLEQEKLELSRKLQGKYMLTMVCSLLELASEFEELLL